MSKQIMVQEKRRNVDFHRGDEHGDEQQAGSVNDAAENQQGDKADDLESLIDEVDKMLDENTDELEKSRNSIIGSRAMRFECLAFAEETELMLARVAKYA